MPGSGGDFFVDLTTTPIFDDAVYFTEALLLSAAENEDHLDAQLAMAAELSDIDQPYRILAHAPESDLGLPAILTSTSALSLHSEQRSSASIRSQETQSTSWTSQPSGRTSHDHAAFDLSPVHHKPPSISRVSLSTDRSGHSLEPIPLLRPNAQHRDSTSSFSVTNSVLSSSSSTRERLLRKPKRASAIFSKFKRTSSTPTSKPRHWSHPGEEVDLDLTTKSDRNGVQSPDVDSLRGSDYSEDGASSLDLPRGSDIDTTTMHTFLSIPETMQPDCKSIKPDAMECETFRSLRNEQREQYQRITLFESNQRKALAAHHHWALKQLTPRCEALRAERKAQHPIELDRLEEFQLKTEHELREAQAIETQNAATALKYMTAYCSGITPIDASLAHDVTNEDRKKLERQRLLQKKLPDKHESAINVLRAKQDRDTRLKLEKQKAELQHLDKNWLTDETKKEETRHAKELARLESTIKKRRDRIMKRWHLRYEMWRKDWEKQNQDSLPGIIPHEEWPENLDAGSLIVDTSTMAVYNGALTDLLMALGNQSLESRLRLGPHRLESY
ncbi:unnamed protein product [Periconia digitata]|uniref:Uncharacterized protein n=1 Tax=Periconia digitata TaxID=1303443 RepID=A0A9W4UK10_9PLEO|nr:unnamed protein product [Periconia digitata]